MRLPDIMTAPSSPPPPARHTSLLPTLHPPENSPRRSPPRICHYRYTPNPVRAEAYHPSLIAWMPPMPPTLSIPSVSLHPWWQHGARSKRQGRGRGTTSTANKQREPGPVDHQIARTMGHARNRKKPTICIFDRVREKRKKKTKGRNLE